MKTEIWKDIPNYEGLYRASNLGNIFSVKRMAILKPLDVGNNHFQVGLYKEKVHKRHAVHRLILLTFIGPSPLVCNHKNSNAADNRLDNLEYCTPAENSMHMVLAGRSARGERAARSKLKESDIPKIFKMRKMGMLAREIGSLFGVDKSTILDILAGKSWKHVPGNFRHLKRIIHHNAKLTEKNVLNIKERFASGHTSRQIASDYRVSIWTIKDIRMGINWSWLTGISNKKDSL